jgi:hypothetical protein
MLRGVLGSDPANYVATRQHHSSSGGSFDSMWGPLRATIPVGSVDRIDRLFYALLVGYLLGIEATYTTLISAQKKYGGALLPAVTN